MPRAARQATVEAQTIRPIFYGGALANDRQKEELLIATPILRTAAFDDQLAAQFAAIDPEASLIVRDCGNWCGDNDSTSYFSFPYQLKQSAGNAAGDWTMAVAKPANVDPGNLVLQAVVNRMDKALVAADGKTGTGAHVHLVYAPADGSPFNVIVEYTLTALHLPSYAQQWQALKQLSINDRGPALKSLLKSLTFSGAEIRTNSSHLDDVWQLTEWDFSAGAGKAGVLEDEIKDFCIPIPVMSSIPDKVPANCPSWKNVWNSVDQAHIPEHFPVKDMLSDLSSYSSSAPAIPRLTLGIPLDVDKPNGDVRDLLALQQCSFCHGAETNTVFRHVVSRAKAGISPTKSGLSCFLTGNKAGQDVKWPTLAQYNENASAYFCEASLVFTVPPGVIGSSGATPYKTGYMVETRKFNELARRGLNMASMLLKNVAPQSATPALDDLHFQTLKAAFFSSYATSRAH